MWRELKSLLQVCRAYMQALPRIVRDAVTFPSLTALARKYRLIFPIPVEGLFTPAGTRFPSGPEAQRGQLYLWRDRHGVQVWRIVGPNGEHRKLPPGVGPYLFKLQHRVILKNRIALGLVLASVVGAVLWAVL